MSPLERSGVGWSVPVPVVPINFLSVPFHLLIYITIYILSSYRVSIKGYCPMKTIWNNWNNWNNWNACPKIISVLILLPAPPKSPFPLESLNSVLSLFTLAIIESSFAVLCHLLIVVVVPTFLFWSFQVTYALQS